MITNSFLSYIANVSKDKVNKVTINGTLNITDFVQKEASGDTVALQYIVEQGSVSDITLIEIKDSSNVVLSSNVVNVPITSDQLILQTLKVMEVV